MFIDTHCHINLMVKKKFNTPLTEKECEAAKIIIKEARQQNVTTLITVGTSLIESINCIELAQQFDGVFAVIGIHPNDATASWRDDFKKIEQLVREKEKNKIVGIGETGLDFYWPGYDKQRQLDVFNTHIELALSHNLALVIHMRNARDELLRCLEQYRGNMPRGIMHCFSDDQSFADAMIDLGFVLGIGGAVTYPKNNQLRTVVQAIPLEKFVLETDAPFLPPQIIRGQQNHPKYIAAIAAYIAELRGESVEQIAQRTTETARFIFGLT